MIKFFVLLFFTVIISAYSKESKHVFVVHSYPQGEWHNGIKKGLKETLSKSKVTFTLEHHLYDYEVLKFKSAKEQRQRVLKIKALISKTNPDYIVLNDDEAIEKLLPELKDFKNLVLNGVNDSPIKSKWAKGIDVRNYCGVTEFYPITQSLKMISMMSSNIKSMSVLSSEGDSSKIVAKIFKGLSKQQLQNIKLRKVSLKSKWSDWKKELLEMNKKDGVGWILVPFEVVDGKGENMPLGVMAQWVKENVEIPLLGILSIHTKMGFLSAISVEPIGLGKQAAEMILKIENGSRCEDIGFEKSKYHNFEINIDEVKRLKFKVPDRFIGVAKFISNKKLEGK